MLRGAFDGIDGESQEPAVDACEVGDGGCEMWGSDQGNARECLHRLSFAVVLFGGAVGNGVAA